MNKEHIDKLLSGRLWLSIISGLVFAYATWKRVLPAEAVAAITTMVFSNYFSRHDRPNGKEAITNGTAEKVI